MVFFSMDKKELVEDTLDHFNYLKQERSDFEGDWLESENLVAPSVKGFNRTTKRPDRPVRFSSRPTIYLEQLVSGIVGYTISPNLAWLKLGLENDKHFEKYGVKKWLELVERVFYSEFNRSNIYTQFPLVVKSGATYGHGVLFMDEDLLNNRLRYSFRAVQEMYLETNEYGDVETYYREFSLPLKQAADFFGLDNLSRELQEDYKDKRKRTTQINFVHAVFRREEYNPELLDQKNMPFASLYIETESEHLIQEGGYRDNPYTCFIWDQIAGTAYGESPAYHANIDIKLLNKTTEARLKVAQLSAQPPMNVPRTMKGSENVVPGGFNYYDKSDQLMSPIQTGANFPISLQVTESMENHIRDWFHVDFFLTLQQQQRQLTATEVMELQGEKAAVLANMIVNLNVTLNAIVQRTFNILIRQGKIPPAPESLKGIGAQLKVDFIGPLAQAQKKYHQSGGTAQALAMIGPIVQMNPAALDYIDVDKLMKNTMESHGMPQAIIREEDDVQQIRAVRQQQQMAQQQQMMQMEQSKNLLSNMDKLNKPVQEGSALEEMGKQMAGSLMG